MKHEEIKINETEWKEAPESVEVVCIPVQGWTKHIKAKTTIYIIYMEEILPDPVSNQSR